MEEGGKNTHPYMEGWMNAKWAVAGSASARDARTFAEIIVLERNV